MADAKRATSGSGKARRKGPGRPPFAPTEEQRYSVGLMAAIGLPQEQIAAALEITRPTLRKHFKAELATGRVRTITKVADSLVRQALAGNITAAIFYLKTRAGWSETAHLDVTSDGQKLQGSVVNVYLPDNQRQNGTDGES